MTEWERLNEFGDFSTEPPVDLIYLEDDLAREVRRRELPVSERDREERRLRPAHRLGRERGHQDDGAEKGRFEGRAHRRGGVKSGQSIVACHSQ